MLVRQVAAAQGWRWVLGGFRLLARKPLALLALLVFDVFLLLLPSILPYIGALMPTLLTPVFGVGLMVAMRATDRGGNPVPQMLFAAFGDEGGRAWRELLALGAISAVATMGAVALSALADGGALLQSMAGMESAAVADVGGGAAAGDNEVAADATDLVLPDVSPALLLFLLLLLPIQAACWYAPLFIAWHRIPVGKSLFFSLVAVWRNKAAFAVYIASWVGAVFAISSVITWITILTGVTKMIVFLMSFAILTAWYGSVWLTYRDIIEPDADEDTPPDTAPPEQLNAE